ncbi:MAG: hypothetical protein R3F34_14195 [Planctomycetota bacterium]
MIGRVVACEPAGWNGPIAPGRRYVATVEYEVDGRLYVLRKRCRTGWRPIVGAAPIVHHASENPRDAGIESVRTSAGHDATLAVALALLGLAAVAVGLVGTGP